MTECGMPELSKAVEATLSWRIEVKRKPPDKHTQSRSAELSRPLLDGMRHHHPRRRTRSTATVLLKYTCAFERKGGPVQLLLNAIDDCDALF